MKLRHLISKFRPSVADALSPHFSLTSAAPGLLTEFKERPDHVMLASEHDAVILLATLDVLDQTFDLSFEPKKAESAVALLRFRKKGSRELVYELPEFGERANYRQVTSVPQYQSLIGQLRRAAAVQGASKSGMPWWGTALVVALAFVCSVFLLAGQVPAAAKTAPAAASSPVTTPPVTSAISSTGDQLNETEKKILAQTVLASGIELRSGGKPFVIFSDPNCPACRQLEARLDEIDKGLSPVVVPVSFKTNSAEAVANILCSKDVAGAWRGAITGQKLSGSGCQKGEDQATANNAAFVALRFERTPTIVAANGKVAVGAKDFDGLLRWIKENSGE
jgi:hypothetical protein